VDAEVGRVLEALSASAVRDSTVVVLTSDHGESLGEHDYYFDHGENLFDPCVRIPLVIRSPEGTPGSRPQMLVSTLDLMPTILDAVKVSWPPDLAGESLLPAMQGRGKPDRPRLVGQNDRSLTALWDTRWKFVATPEGKGARLALFDRKDDPAELEDVSASRAAERRQLLRELELFQESADGERSRTARLLEGATPEGKLSAEACESLKALGYVHQGCE
jgi:arylsulfatase A-like enzyme